MHIWDMNPKVMNASSHLNRWEEYSGLLCFIFFKENHIKAASKSPILAPCPSRYQVLSGKHVLCECKTFLFGFTMRQRMLLFWVSYFSPTFIYSYLDIVLVEGNHLNICHTVLIRIIGIFLNKYKWTNFFMIRIWEWHIQSYCQNFAKK